LNTEELIQGSIVTELPKTIYTEKN